MTAKKLKVLVVEDNVNVQFLIQRFLQPIAWVETALDGEEGLEAFRRAINREEPYDLLCIDIMLPRMDGVEMLKQIRELEKEKGHLPGRGVKALMISALNDPKSVMKSFSELCHGYLIKPVAKQALYDKIRELGFELD